MVAPVNELVWRQLDPHAGRLPRRTRRRMLLVATLITLVGIGLSITWQGGLPLPRLVAGSHTFGTQPGQFRYDVTLTNHNRWLPVRVLDVGRSGPGLELTETAGFAARALEPGESMELTLEYRVTDCAAVTEEPWPMPVQIARPWGVQTIHLHLPTYPSDDAPEMYSYSGRDPYAVEWQRYAADLACRPR